MSDGTGYWNTVGAAKTYSHPFELAWLGEPSPTARVIDYGCGSGRLTAVLYDAGWTGVEGVDIAPAAIDRARTLAPGPAFHVLDRPPRLRYADGEVDAVLLVAVLTCLPSDDDQRRLVEELHRVLRPGGVLCVSDYPLQEDRRNLDRYERSAARYGTYGVFTTGDGAVCRHHDPAWFDTLLGGFAITRTRRVPVRTMNGHPATAVQFRAVKPVTALQG
ncbi:MAG: hypothetical protein QG622_3048 [Actinomycetota bacterium]|nr:hypothetical protein [Actinomycetota bacterium]